MRSLVVLPLLLAFLLSPPIGDTVEIGLLEGETFSSVRIPYYESFCDVPLLIISDISGDGFSLSIDRETPTGFVVSILRENADRRDTVRFYYQAIGETWPCTTLTNKMYIPLVIQ